ncbi:MAG: Mth938-like domain-containing protein [Gammaproteobacteria bacterium]|jgi:uncharacterized protein
MRFAEDSLAVNTIRAYDAGEIIVNDTRITQSVIITPNEIRRWPPYRFTDLLPEHLGALAELQPEIVILGTGSRQRFLQPGMTAELQTSGIGVEIMATDAACRTFNILLAEERRVVAALIMG